jgi:hypothetical protein
VLAVPSSAFPRSAVVIQICCAEIQTTRNSAERVVRSRRRNLPPSADWRDRQPPQLVCLAIGLMARAGLFLRDVNLRMVLPVRRLA